MNSKNVILARPNTFILKSMKQLLKDCNCIPTPINRLSMLNEFNSNQVSGVVVSTAVISSVGEDLEVVIKAVAERYTGVPILMASMIGLDKIKDVIDLKLKKMDLDFTLISAKDAYESGPVNPKNQIIVLEKKDISDEEKYPITLNKIRKYFGWRY